LNPHRSTLLAALLALSAVSAVGAESPYSAAARKFAEAVVEHALDHYGPRHTPLFAQIIDLRTLEIPKQWTAAEWRAEMAGWKDDKNYSMWGKDRSSVAWARDSNLLWDTDTVRLLYELGDERLTAAADAYLRYFLANCVSPSTGLFAWGEHVAYNLVEDRVIGRRHELQHFNPLWEELWKFDPVAVRRAIESIYAYHITDKRTMAYDRHANFWNGLPERDQATILGYAGYFTIAFEFLGRKTGDPKYDEWSRRLVLAFQAKSDDTGLYPDNWTDRMAREQPLVFPVRPEIAAAFYGNYRATKDKRWLDDANRYLEACDAAISAGRVQPVERLAWSPVLGAAAIQGYRLTGNASYLRMAERIGGEHLKMDEPRAQMAGYLAVRLNFFLDLYEATSDSRWLGGARRLGDHALRAFVHPSGLIRGTAVVDRPDYYDAIQGPGMLARALLRLGQRDSNPLAPGKPLWKPAQPSGPDTAPPAIGELDYSPLAANAARVPVRVQISDASGVSRATLHYTYGTEVGFEDSKPKISGNTYIFHIEPPGTAFIGEVSFAVEAVDASPARNRAISRWRRMKLVLEQDGSQLSNWPPADTKPPRDGWVAANRYWTVTASPPGERFRVTYAPEDTWRLIEATLTLAYWNGTAWTRVPSRLNLEHRTVTANYQGARYWALLGEDRVLWRAAGRETGPALADVDRDGKLEVLTTNYLPGQLLSSSGKPIADFPIDQPYHPVINSSSPAVAQWLPGGEALLLFGAPSGYVYAYDRTGKRRWRTEVGGEILGGPAVGVLLPGGRQAVAVNWGGGVSVIDPSGALVWQKEHPVPAASTPVLIDLDGDGQLEVVVNAGAEILALDGGDGRLRWRFTAPGRQFCNPAAGAFTRDGKPRIVAGDDQGSLYALDELGNLLWRQERIFGPREVPEPVEQYLPISEIGLADLDRRDERQVIATTKGGETVALSARGERLWRYSSYERRVGIALNMGARMAFADLDQDGRLEVILAQQDSYIHVLDHQGREKWTYLGYFWYHYAPAVADLQGTGELNIVFTGPEEGGTFALRSGVRGKPGQAPWPMMRGGLERTNCAPW
jgi:outer membrane protein assembly factor BamB